MAGLAISATVFGFNILGDELRDELDPRLRGRELVPLSMTRPDVQPFD